MNEAELNQVKQAKDKAIKELESKLSASESSIKLKDRQI
jgi:hypothetical protein